MQPLAHSRCSVNVITISTGISPVATLTVMLDIVPGSGDRDEHSIIISENFQSRSDGTGE